MRIEDVIAIAGGMAHSLALKSDGTVWAWGQNSHGELLRYYEAETVAISDRDPVAARSACVDRAEAMGRIMLTELVRRRVLAPLLR